ncbi:MAG: 50S ribosomal protein L32e [Ignisphaera sp.]
MSADYKEMLAKRIEILRSLRKKRRVLLLKMRMRKPEFLRWLWWKFAKFENNLKWKRPRGKDNPVRLALKGYPPKASIGYGTPNEIKDLHPSGLKPVVVANVADLNKLDPSKHIVYIASSVGLKKRLELVKLAKSKGLKVANER